MKARCVCGCGRKAGHDHHVITRAELRKYVRAPMGHDRQAKRIHRALVVDRRNIVRVAFGCHGAHHDASVRLRLAVLPDSVFEFALEVMGAGPAYEFLRRHYAGDDVRLSQLLEGSDGASVSAGTARKSA